MKLISEFSVVCRGIYSTLVAISERFLISDLGESNRSITSSGLKLFLPQEQMMIAVKINNSTYLMVIWIMI